MRRVADAHQLRRWQCISLLLNAWGMRLGSARREAIALATEALSYCDEPELEGRCRWERAQSRMSIDLRSALEDLDWVLDHVDSQSYLRPGTHVSRAQARFSLGEWEGAAQDAESAVRCADLGPPRVRSLAWTELAKVELARGRLAEAAEGFAAATAERERQGLPGGYSECYLASTLVLLGKHTAALPVLDRLVEREAPGNVAELRVWRAVSRQALGDSAGAERDVERASAWFSANRTRPDTAVRAAELLLGRTGLSQETARHCAALIALAEELGV